MGVMERLRFSEYCANCRKPLGSMERVLFVEKEIGRCFCSEDCIREYFQPTVELMQEELGKVRSQGDFTEAEASRMAQYRLLTLQDPDEVWLEDTDSGERRFTFISHFRHGDEPFSYVVVCLTIDGEPSFIFLNFPTRDQELVTAYRRGRDLRVNDEVREEEEGLEVALPVAPPPLAAAAEPVRKAMSDPDSLSEWERLYAEARQPGDVPVEDFAMFAEYVEPTIDDPEEIWSFRDDEGNPWVTFIANYSEEEGGPSAFRMIVVCQPTKEEGKRALDVVFAFPTLDAALAQRFRRGLNSLNKSYGVGWARGRAA